ncbi:MAG: NUDIX hydrolase, partial [Candidatus Thermoplasmatota archaeon]|nr:NUDIX hydrolase [Candidatus Thermoplasmatota archaeon]
EVIRLPTESELSDFGISWEEVRTNKFRLGQEYHTVVHGKPLIDWPGEWAWKDSVISDNAVDPVARESVYRTIHRVVSKVMILNSQDQVLLAKVSRGFFSGCWTLPGGFVDYGEHPREAAVREAMEELGISIVIDDPKGENGEPHGAGEEAFIQEEIFNEDGINWISFTYKCHGEFEDREIIPKDDEIEEARWFRIPEAIDIAVSIFDIEALKRLI